MAFNGGNPFPDYPVMTFHPASACPNDESCEPIVANECAIAPDVPAPAREARRADGRRGRFRLDDTPPDEARPRIVTGSIAVSFAIVSRRNWPR
ncbi:hypothetical protein LGN04_10180 [Burkholderia multivorans]|uniref:Uncharacterized protein n=1 Tax=Burkholderia multivorans TaxID=87883 RepID=A0AAP2HGC7_9BURK|nr:hypothetical protein [Burkholderia multivorans]MBU9355720.1 hypothetical protein [Burkholderia multivorans]MBU9361112.1 hypothetical protein [Burkholderia multivorans]MBU9593115.1 hypothetical protein [Burkholderia multivorans]MCA8454286.1 hypothetical protein [Burkholderia multivorans]MCA8482405.1 hypothetical protein [Burkholderia multivorans]